MGKRASRCLAKSRFIVEFKKVVFICGWIDCGKVTSRTNRVHTKETRI